MKECIYFYYATTENNKTIHGTITNKEIKKNSDFMDILEFIKSEIKSKQDISLEGFTLQSFSLIGHRNKD